VATREEDVRFVDERERELFATAMLGEKAVTFFRNDPVGQYLHHRAKKMVAEAQVEALAVDPDGWRGWFFSRRKLRLIRQRAALGRLFINWLADAIIDGRNAEKELTDYRNTEN
jgi:hypothetical protein